MSDHLTPKSTNEEGEKDNTEQSNTDAKKAIKGVKAGLAAARALGVGIVVGVGKKIGEYMVEDFFHGS